MKSNNSSLSLDIELLDACMRGGVDLPDQIAKLSARGANPNHGADRRGLPLGWCARQGRIDAMQALIDAGADVGARDCRDRQALAWCAKGDQFEAAAMLLAHGADPEGRVSVREMVSGKMVETVSTHAILCAQEGAAQCLRMILARGANPNGLGDSGESPLIAAIEAQSSASIRVLIAAGADPNIRRRAGAPSAFFELCRLGRLDWIEMVVESCPSSELIAKAVRGCPAELDAFGSSARRKPNGEDLLSPHECVSMALLWEEARSIGDVAHKPRLAKAPSLRM